MTSGDWLFLVLVVVVLGGFFTWMARVSNRKDDQRCAALMTLAHTPSDSLLIIAYAPCDRSKS